MNIKYPSKELVESLRNRYPEGTRVELLSMSDPYTTLQRGDKGTVSMVDDIGTIFVNWDNGSGLGVAYGEDHVRKLERELDAEAPSQPENDTTQSAPESSNVKSNRIPPEYAHWIAKTESSRFRWTEDEIFRLNGRGAMYYHGGVDGIYLQIHKDGRVNFGKYEGAFPHIGDAIFDVLVEIQTKDFNEAFATAMNWGGKQFLVDMFSGHNYLRSAELDAEQNYNMVDDGLLNNIEPPKPDLTDGQTYDEIRELAPETLPQEIHSAKDDKPSLLGQIERFRAESTTFKTEGAVAESEREL